MCEHLIKSRDSHAHGEPHNVSASIALGRERAKPKSATLSMGTPIGWPRLSSSSPTGLRSRFCESRVNW